MTATVVNAASAVVEVYTTLPQYGTYSTGTGFFIGPNTVATAEHVVVENNMLAEPISVLVNGQLVRAHFVQTALPPFLNYFPVDRDYAVLSLDQPIGLSTGWFGMDQNFTSGPVTVSGFPGDLGYQEIYVNNAYDYNSPAFGKEVVLPGANMQHGFSGGPAWTNTNGRFNAVGILSAGGFAGIPGGAAADLTPAVVSRLQAWDAADNYLVADTVNRAHVTKLYKIGLLREPTASELDYWAGQLGAGLSPSDVYSMVVKLAPFQVSLLYDTLFNRLPTVSELNSWVGKMNAGTTLHDMEVSLLAGTEFLATPGAQNAGAFIDQLALNIFGYELQGQARADAVSLTEQLGELAIADAVSSETWMAEHIAIIGSINPLNAGGLA